MQCNIIGAGRLGKNIALALTTSGIASVQALCNRSLASAQQACAEIDAGVAIHHLKDLPPADITWITSNDDSIQLIVKQLAENAFIKPGSFIIHCSGVLDSSILSPFKSLNCFVASVHPLKAFKTNYLQANAFNLVDCVLEGDEPVCAWLNTLFISLGANVLSIKQQAKSAYHAAACMASNYLVTLAACSEELLIKAGMTQKQSRTMICQLMQGNINNLLNTQNISESLTGPLMRGDHETLSLHLQAIDNPYSKEFYKSAGLATLALTQLEDEAKFLISEALSST